MVTLLEFILHPKEIARFCVTVFSNKGPMYDPSSFLLLVVYAA